MVVRLGHGHVWSDISFFDGGVEMVFRPRGSDFLPSWADPSLRGNTVQALCYAAFDVCLTCVSGALETRLRSICGAFVCGVFVVRVHNVCGAFEVCLRCFHNNAKLFEIPAASKSFGF